MVANTGSSNNAFVPKQLSFGAQTNTAFSSQCQVAEFIIYHGQLGDSSRQKVEGYLARKYGLTGSLPSAHPWKNSTYGPFDLPTNVGGQDATITFYWGDDNASNVANNWDHNYTLSSTQAVGLATHKLTGLTKGTTYYYTAYISNSGGNSWADVKTFVPALTQLGKDSIPDLALWLDAMDVNGD